MSDKKGCQFDVVKPGEEFVCRVCGRRWSIPGVTLPPGVVPVATCRGPQPTQAVARPPIAPRPPLTPEQVAEVKAKREAALKEQQALADAAYAKLGILTKTGHYTAALARWAKAGFPVNSPAETERRAAICAACDRYAVSTCCCSICGCPINANGLPVKSKVQIATENCPNPGGSKWA